MQIEFRKIEHNLVPFNFKKGNLVFSGTLKQIKKDLVECEAKIEGTLLTQCVRCAEDFQREIGDTLILKISDGIVSSSEDLDIIEMHEGCINFDEILQSEIESYHCEYNICDNCKNLEINYEG